MRALSTVPPVRLAGVDPAFQLLDGGLGAVFSASLARRAAVQRDKGGGKGGKGRADLGTVMGQLMSKGLGEPGEASEPLRAAGLSLSGPSTALRGKQMFKRAVRKLAMPSRRFAAQQATMQMFAAFTDDRVKATSSRGSVGEMRGIGSAIDEGDEGAHLDEASMERPDEVFEEVLQDGQFREWAEEHLGVEPDRLDQWLGLAKFREKLDHQMLRWPLMRRARDHPGFVASPVMANRVGAAGDGHDDGNPCGSPVRAAAREAAAAVRRRRAEVGRCGGEGPGGARDVCLRGVHTGGNLKQRQHDEEFAEILPVVPSFVVPSGSITSADVAGGPDFVYIRRCELAGLVPCQAAWRRFGGGAGIVDVGNRSLSDADIAAVVETAVQCAADGQAWRALDISGSALTDSGLERVACLIADAPQDAIAQVHSVSLANNTHLRMRIPRALEELARAFVALEALTELDLSGVVLRGAAAQEVAVSLEKCERLKTLNLANCRLGNTDQADCVAIASLLSFVDPSAICLTSVDLSGNYFGRRGFAAVAAALRTSRLKSLSFSGNGGGRWAGGVNADGREQGPRFHPMQLLIEGFQANTSLEHIDLSASGLGPDSAFVLEDAMRAHPRAKTLLLAENPFGDEGLRCVIRLLISIGPDISSCDARGVREADAQAHRVRFRYSQPGGIYFLNLALPHERAVLRTLLRLGAKLRGGALRYFKFDSRFPKPAVELDVGANIWSVPSSGQCSFSFNPPLSEAARLLLQERAAAGGEMRVTSVNSVGAHPPNRGPARPGGAAVGGAPRSSVWVNSTAPIMGRNGSEPMTRLSTGGASVRGRGGQDDTSVADGARPQSRASSSASSLVSTEGDWSEVSRLLTDARMQVSALRFPLIRGMLLSLITHAQQLCFVRACSRDMWLNAAQVSRLCEDCPEIAAEVACVLFPSVRGRSAQLMLLGNNAHVRSSKKVLAAVSSAMWFQEGNLSGRYRLNLAEPADCAVAENCLLVNAWEAEVGRILGKPDVSQRGNYEMLRNEEHNEVPFTYTRDWFLPSHGWLSFDYSSIRRPAGTEVAMPEASEITKFLKSNNYSANAKLKALRAISTHLYMSAQQFKNVALCFPEGVDRQDVFCLLHTRVVDPANLLGPMTLYAPAIFSEADRMALFRRIGHLHLLNPLHPDHIPYLCRLAVYEERRVVELLVLLTMHEAGGRVLRHVAGSVGVVPASWVGKGVPCEDMVLDVTYETQTVNAGWRQELAKTYCVGTYSAAVA